VNSNLQAVLECLEIIWAPGAEALKSRQALGEPSLAGMPAALERAGYEVCYADLPERVSGFAAVIDGKPHIVLNRAKSSQHSQCTLLHELAHHILHLRAETHLRPGISLDGIEEFQAHQFAVAWILLLGNDRERQTLLIQNPELAGVALASLIFTAGVLLIPLLLHIRSLFVRTPIFAPMQSK
jgi:hypothetical protein